jgi:3',5'-cyclic AMP phosphodiesterase CpdA
MSSPPVLRYLHLSDLHFRTSDPGRRHDQNSVTDSLLEAIKDFPDTEPLDFIALTGDIAYSGQREEYELAAEFCDKLLKITRVPRNRLYLVAGNHDQDRKQVSKTLSRLYNRFVDQEEAPTTWPTPVSGR